MWLTSSEQEAVDLFWKLCGEKEPFPRNLERPLALALPVALIKLPQLKLKDIENWIKKHGLTFTFECDYRFVRGCLIAHAGQGILFIDGTDPIDEQRFTLAHEIAHFLID